MITDQGGYGSASGVEGADGPTQQNVSESSTAYTVRQRKLARHKHTHL